jgi:Rrf2 family iron-sulfur cluster assembly transcriptional regulator
MMLTTKVRYAVMAMVDIAVLSTQRGSKPIKLGEIAERQDIALNYLEQIFAKLKTAGLVQAVKGPGGGYIIAKDKCGVSIADIVDAVDESVEMTRCGTETVKGGCMPDSTKCVTHDIWEGLTKQIRHYLSGVTLEAICKKVEAKQSLKSILEFAAPHKCGE